MKKGFISVIVPVYNVERYICKCVDSILRQTYSNLDIILVDDGSTDNSFHICDEYAGVDPRVRVVHKKNGGLSSARNVGLDIAFGEYIAFIDGDDYIHPEMLERLYCTLEDSKADMSVCNLQYVDENGHALSQYRDNIIKKEILSADDVFQKSLEHCGQFYIVVCNKLYKRELWKTYRFREGKIHEDEFAFHHIIGQCSKISCISDIGYYYVQHTGSIMAGQTADKKMDAIESFLERMDYFKWEKKWKYLLDLDKACYYAICNVKKIYKNHDEKLRFRNLEKKYKINHQWILSNLDYPFSIRIKRLIYRYFPFVFWLFRKTKDLLKVLKYEVDFLRILIQSKWIYFFSKNKKCIYFISTPTHGNLGDQAIVYAQYHLMKECGVKKYVIEITRYSYEHLCIKLDTLVRKDDLIVIDGGGNLGTLWIEEEEKMRDIINRFSQNPVFIFPQTAYYEQSRYGQKELEKSAAVYSNHSNLTIFCRDKITYDLVNKNFHHVKSLYTPDMVPFLLNVQQKTERNGILLCLRKDLESVQKEDFFKKLKTFFFTKGYTVREISTLVNKKVTKWNRQKELEKKWKEFSSAKLVITDRLHGMIFSAVTGTPCIALDNISHKVRDGYEWLDCLPYITFCACSLEKVLEKAENICREYVEYQYDRSSLEPYYTIIKEEIKNAFDKK